MGFADRFHQTRGRRFHGRRHRSRLAAATRFRPGFERLEERRLLAVVHWVGGDGDWDDPANWSSQQVPGPDDTASIDVADEVTVTHSASDHTVEKLLGEENLLVSGGRLSIAGQSQIDADLSISGGELTGPGELVVNGQLEWTGGRISGTGRTLANGGISVGGIGLELIQRTIDNAATLVALPGTDIGAGFGTVINNLPGATFHISGDILGYHLGGDPAVINNQGTLITSDGGGYSELGRVYNTGRVQLETGVLAVDQYTQTAGETVLAGGHLGASMPIDLAGGRLSGSGWIDGDLINSGEVSPDASPRWVSDPAETSAAPVRSAEGVPGASAGRIDVEGDYQQLAFGTLRIDLGGPAAGIQYDQLTVSGSASLAGALVVTLTDGFTPAPGDRFVVAAIDSGVDGEFEEVDLPELPPGLEWSMSYTGGEVALAVEQPVQIPPEALLASAADVLAPDQATQTIVVEFTDDVAIDVSTLGDNDIRVIGGPADFNAAATLLKIDDPSDGSPRRATYEIDAPSGVWDAEDNGTYDVFMESQQVADVDGNFAASGLLGSFGVGIEPVEPEVSIADARVVEGDSEGTNVVFAVGLSMPGDRPIHVDFATHDGSAMSGSDYVAGSGALLIPPGQTHTEVVVAIVGDLADEGLIETFFVELSNAVGGELADGHAVGTIVDDDVVANAETVDTLLDLAAAFGMTGSASYAVSANGNPGLFSAVTIDDTTATLRLQYAPDAVGHADITVTASGADPVQSGTYTFGVTVDRDRPVLREFSAHALTGLDGSPTGIEYVLTFSEALLAPAPVDGLFPPGAANNPANYRLVALGTGDDVRELITDVHYFPGLEDVATETVPPRVVVEVKPTAGLADERYELTFFGSKVTDLAGNHFLAGDADARFDFATTPPGIGVQEANHRRARAVTPLGGERPDLVVVEFSDGALGEGGVRNVHNYRLERLDPDGSVAARLPLAEPVYDRFAARVLLRGFPPLEGGTYRLTIFSEPDPAVPGATGITSLSGVPLDGDGDGQPGGLLVEEFAVAADVGPVGVDDGLFEGNFRSLDQRLNRLLPQVEDARRTLTGEAFARRLLDDVRLTLLAEQGSDSQTIAEAVNRRIAEVFRRERDAEFLLRDFLPGEFIIVWGNAARFLLQNPDNPGAEGAVGYDAGSRRVEQVAGAVLVDDGQGPDGLSLAIVPVQLAAELLSDDLLVTRVDQVSVTPNLTYSVELQGVSSSNQAGVVYFSSDERAASIEMVDSPAAGVVRQFDLSDLLTGMDPLVEMVNQAVLDGIRQVLGPPGEIGVNLLVLWFDPIDYVLADAQGRTSEHVGSRSIDQVAGSFYRGSGFTELLVIPHAVADVYSLQLVGLGSEYRGVANFLYSGGSMDVPLQGHLGSLDRLLVRVDFRTSAGDGGHQGNGSDLGFNIAAALAARPTWGSQVSGGASSSGLLAMADSGATNTLAVAGFVGGTESLRFGEFYTTSDQVGPTTPPTPLPVVIAKIIDEIFAALDHLGRSMELLGRGEIGIRQFRELLEELLKQDSGEDDPPRDEDRQDDAQPDDVPAAATFRNEVLQQAGAKAATPTADSGDLPKPGRERQSNTEDNARWAAAAVVLDGMGDDLDPSTVQPIVEDLDGFSGALIPAVFVSGRAFGGRLEQTTTDGSPSARSHSEHTIRPWWRYRATRKKSPRAAT